MFLAPEEISRVRLRRSFRGYHPGDVQDLLRELAAGHAHLVAQLDEAERERAALRARLERCCPRQGETERLPGRRPERIPSERVGRSWPAGDSRRPD